MNTQPKSDFVKHIPCDHCGSSDANALYTDGHTHCFKCGVTEGETSYTSKSDMNSAPKPITMLLTGDIAPIPDRGISRATCEAFNVMQPQNPKTPVF